MFEEINEKFDLLSEDAKKIVIMNCQSYLRGVNDAKSVLDGHILNTEKCIQDLMKEIDKE